MADYVDVAQDGGVKLNVDSALRLAYVHSPSHQTQLETLYVSALDVTAERFRLDTQFFGGYDASVTSTRLADSSALGYNRELGRYLRESGLSTEREPRTTRDLRPSGGRRSGAPGAAAIRHCG